MSNLSVISYVPLEFFDYLKRQSMELYTKVCDLIIFEEVYANTFRLQKLYLEGIWDRKTEKNQDQLWWEFCRIHS